MRKVWIVVANSSCCKIYHAENTHTLLEQRSFSHEESHLPARELTSDRQGRETSRYGYGTDTMQEQTAVKVKETKNFAQQIAKALEQGLQEQAYERLYLIVNSPLLGALRPLLHPNVTKTVALEVAKDVTQLKPEQIRDYLPPVL